jgi:carbon-monoxide dehydrogenase medium subunit
LRAYGAEEMVTGQEITERVIEACCERARDEVEPITDIRATAEYRKSMASVLLRRAIERVTSMEKR